LGILVIGSFMMDLVVRTSRAPEAGETLIGESFGKFPGGKGANQAVAAARLGAAVVMAGKLGDDMFGHEMRVVMEQEGVDIRSVLADKQLSTGVGTIVLEQNGQNRIIVVPGANLNYTAEETEQITPLIQQSQMLMLQLEMDMAVIEKATEIAHLHGVPIILNPAPARVLGDELLKRITYLTPNETELALLTGKPITTLEDIKQAAGQLLDKGVQHVIVTLAEKGAMVVGANGALHIPGFPVQAIDTVAAGDSFNGALAFQLVNGAQLVEAVMFANVVGALTVTKSGAIPSLPRLAEVKQFIKTVD
jgi:ribokinase